MEVSTVTNDGSSPEKSRRPGPLTAWASAVWEEGRHGADTTEPVSDAASLPYVRPVCSPYCRSAPQSRPVRTEDRGASRRSGSASRWGPGEVHLSRPSPSRPQCGPAFRVSAVPCSGTPRSGPSRSALAAAAHLASVEYRCSSSSSPLLGRTVRADASTVPQMVMRDGSPTSVILPGHASHKATHSGSGSFDGQGQRLGIGAIPVPRAIRLMQRGYDERQQQNPQLQQVEERGHCCTNGATSVPTSASSARYVAARASW